MISKKFTESQRREFYSQLFNQRFNYLGDVHTSHCWAKFGRENDNICRSYFTGKNKHWKQFLEFGRKYIPKYINPETAYELEGNAPDEEPVSQKDLNDSGN